MRYGGTTPRARIDQKRTQEDHTHLSSRVAGYETSLSADINHDGCGIPITNHVRLTAVVAYPDDRAEQSIEITLYGTDRSSSGLHSKLHDIQERDEHGSPKYRTYRGREIPVFKPPNGLGVLEKVRGESGWASSLFVTTHFVDQAIALLGRYELLFVELHECKIDRTRWIRGISLHTSDPNEEYDQVIV